MRTIAILFAIVVISIPCAGATIIVNWDGTGDYTTIQAGINAAVSGVDTVEVAEGTYYENINFGGKNIVLTSIDPTDLNIVRDTVIDGSGSGRGVRFSGAETSSCELTGFTIQNGYVTQSGGGIWGRETLATISNCIITGNWAEVNGGGISSCQGAITNCTITGNSTVYGDGGGVSRCHGVIKNCIISGNISSYVGGGLYDCDGEITNCTIANNTGDYAGSGLYVCNGTITNCIVWGNSASIIDQVYQSSTPTYSCIQDWTGSGLGNISYDPLFVNEAGNDYHLQSWSRCIDRGTNFPPGGLTAIDFDGNPRPIDGNNDGQAFADMGVYEAYPSIEPVIWVSAVEIDFFAHEGESNPDDQIVTIWNSGGETINWTIVEDCNWLTVTPESGSSTGEQDDVTLSVDIAGLSWGQYSCDLVITDPCAMNNPQTVNINLGIARNLFVPSQYPTIQSAINASNVQYDIIIVSPGTYYENIYYNGKNIIVTSTNPSDPNVETETIIDGGGSNQVVAFKGTETSACELRGFTITNGHDGGGVEGGGIHGNGTGATISECIITGNSAIHGGGLYECDGVILNCTIIENSANTGGGLDSCDGTITNCTIAGNTGIVGGGLYGCNGLMTNCIISGNTASQDGGGLFSCDSTIINCTIIGNSANDEGGGFCRCNGSVTNSIIWDNLAVNVGDQLYLSSAPVYSCIQDWSGGTGNISLNPLFADEANDDYHLKSETGRWDPNTDSWVTDVATSPCIDVGDPNSDWTGELWPDGGRINMGAYGGTAQASMSLNPVGNVADFNKDGVVGLGDFGWYYDSWQLGEILLAEDIDRNNFVDILDLLLFAREWLWEQ